MRDDGEFRDWPPWQINAVATVAWGIAALAVVVIVRCFYAWLG